VLLNNVLLPAPHDEDALAEDAPIHCYSQRVDHLGSDREFLGPGDEAELGKRQSLLTLPVFESAEPAASGPAPVSASGSSPTASGSPRCIAVLQVSKAASKHVPVHMRVFSPAEVMVLSTFAHSAVWSLLNAQQLTEVQSRNLAMRAALSLPRRVLAALDPAAPSGSELQRAGVARSVEAAVKALLPVCRRARLFGVLRADQDYPERSRLCWFPHEQEEGEEDLAALKRRWCEATSSIAGQCVVGGMPLELADAYNDRDFNANIDLDPDGLGLVTVPVPAPRGGPSQAVLQLTVQITARKRSHLLSIVEDLASQAGVAVELSGIALAAQP
jgi:GAF domain-containing protein